MEQKEIRKTAYVTEVGDVTFVVQNSFTGTKTLTKAFEEIIIDSFREKCLERMNGKRPSEMKCC